MGDSVGAGLLTAGTAGASSGADAGVNWQTAGMPGPSPDSSTTGNIASAISSLFGRSLTPPVYAAPSTGLGSTTTILLVGGLGLAALYFIATKD